MFTNYLKPRTPRARPGFTLIELLVVIAIIAILASILFPVFARARENARRSACQSNLKQIGLGILQYCQDFDEILPYSDYGTDFNGSDLVSGGTRYKWMDAIYPYVKSQQMFNCPSRPKGFSDYIYGNGTNYGSYAVNFMYRYYTTYPGFKSPAGSAYLASQTHMAEVANSSETVWAVCRGGKTNPSNANSDNAYNFMINCGPPFNAQCNPDTGIVRAVETSTGLNAVYLGNNYSASLAERHLETTNVLWVDGHVKAMKMDALLTQGNITAGTNRSLKYFTITDD